jgi:hypothetical protein
MTMSTVVGDRSRGRAVVGQIAVRRDSGRREQACWRGGISEAGGCRRCKSKGTKGTKARKGDFGRSEEAEEDDWGILSLEDFRLFEGGGVDGWRDGEAGFETLWEER